MVSDIKNHYNNEVNSKQNPLKVSYRPWQTDHAISMEKLHDKSYTICYQESV